MKLSIANVHGIAAASELMTREKLIECVGMLCRSHENLRSEAQSLRQALMTLSEFDDLEDCGDIIKKALAT